MKARPFLILVSVLWLLFAACANIVPPGGGPKDTAPPRLVHVDPADSQLNIRPSRIDLTFDEYITLTDASSQIQISPLLSLPLTSSSQNRKVRIEIPDSLLQPETSYRITFGTAIRDLHEGNTYEGGVYTFSTGAYFDSLRLFGRVWSGNTGLPDTGAHILLYDGRGSDSAVIRQKPLYVTHTDASGYFRFEGLPERPFRVYALRDGNANLIFDGGPEWIGFFDSTVIPDQADSPRIILFTFQEESTDSVVQKNEKPILGSREAAAAELPRINPGEYAVAVDTQSQSRRSQDITRPIDIAFGRQLSGTLNRDRIFLSVDSAGSTVEVPFTLTRDTTGLRYDLHTNWKEDALYTLRLQKGFAVDSNGQDLRPGRYTFRTKRGEDYGSLKLHLPARYRGEEYILQVANERDTIYQKPLKDTVIFLPRIAPGSYSFRVIEDRNRNGKWDAGSLFPPRQPERVRPHTQKVMIKAGWEQEIDFDPEASQRQKGGK